MGRVSTTTNEIRRFEIYDVPCKLPVFLFWAGSYLCFGVDFVLLFFSAICRTFSRRESLYEGEWIRCTRPRICACRSGQMLRNLELVCGAENIKTQMFYCDQVPFFSIATFFDSEQNSKFSAKLHQSQKFKSHRKLSAQRVQMYSHFKAWET